MPDEPHIPEPDWPAFDRSAKALTRDWTAARGLTPHPWDYFAGLLDTLIRQHLEETLDRAIEPYTEELTNRRRAFARETVDAIADVWVASGALARDMAAAAAVLNESEPGDGAQAKAAAEALVRKLSDQAKAQHFFVQERAPQTLYRLFAEKISTPALSTIQLPINNKDIKLASQYKINSGQELDERIIKNYDIFYSYLDMFKKRPVSISLFIDKIKIHIKSLDVELSKLISTTSLPYWCDPQLDLSNAISLHHGEHPPDPNKSSFAKAAAANAREFVRLIDSEVEKLIQLARIARAEAWARRVPQLDAARDVLSNDALTASQAAAVHCWNAREDNLLSECSELIEEAIGAGGAANPGVEQLRAILEIHTARRIREASRFVTTLAGRRATFQKLHAAYANFDAALFEQTVSGFHKLFAQIDVAQDRAAPAKAAAAAAVTKAAMAYHEEKTAALVEVRERAFIELIAHAVAQNAPEDALGVYVWLIKELNRGPIALSNPELAVRGRLAGLHELVALGCAFEAIRDDGKTYFVPDAMLSMIDEIDARVAERPRIGQ